MSDEEYRKSILENPESLAFLIKQEASSMKKRDVFQAAKSVLRTLHVPSDHSSLYINKAAIYLR